MIALGIDAATKTGWALVQGVGHGGENLLDWGVLDFNKHKADPWNPAAFLALHCRPPAPTPNIVAIELPFLGPSPHTLEVLARICGRFEQAFGPSGAEVRVVRSNQWQPKMLGPTRLKRAMLKKLAVAWCKANFGEDLPQDAADAAVIAVHSLRFPA
jgi:Holliday junction resolvasome RuvABC endonuclease subunit